MQTRNSIEAKLKHVDVVILCGGAGSRLREVVNDRPKPMAEINQGPFLDILIDYFASFGFRRFVLCTGHMAEVIQHYYGHKNGLLEFVLSDERTPLGTAGAVKNAERYIRSDPFLVANGDSFCPADLAEFYNFHSARQALLSMVAVESEHQANSGLVVLDGLQRIVSFEEKKQRSGTACISAGIYLFQKNVLTSIPTGTKYSLEYDLFPKLTGRGCFGYVAHAKLIDIGTPRQYESAKKCFVGSLKVPPVRDFPGNEKHGLTGP